MNVNESTDRQGPSDDARIKSWRRVRESFKSDASLPNGELLKPLVDLIDSLVAKGAEREYFAWRSISRLAVGIDPADAQLYRAFVGITPRSDGSLICELWKSEPVVDAGPTTPEYDLSAVKTLVCYPVDAPNIVLSLLRG